MDTQNRDEDAINAELFGNDQRGIDDFYGSPQYAEQIAVKYESAKSIDNTNKGLEGEVKQ